MGLDTNQKLLADYNDVFADILNVLLFDGKEVIKEEGLTNAKDRSIYKASDERLSRLLSSEEIEERKERGITMCDLFERTINIGVEQERANTEEQRKRADDLEKQLSVLKAENAEMEKRIKELERSQ